MTRTIRILTAVSHSIFRGGLRKLLESQSECSLVGEATSTDSALRLVRQLDPDILLLDLRLAREDDGSRALDQLCDLSRSPDSPKVILLTASADRPYLTRAMLLGASGVVPKMATSQMLFKGIRAVMDGDMWISRDSLIEILDTLRTDTNGATDARRLLDLTPRERAIIRAVVDGQMNKDIAASFNISEHTVKHHLTRIFTKLNVSNRVELAMFAVRHSVVDEIER
jgi:DNA-binding NarL/FixJ family response regulator